MPSHSRIDPQDQYSQAELLVEFEGSVGNVKLISAHDGADEDILFDLEDTEKRALETEIAADYRRDAPSRDGRLHQRPVPGQP